MSMIDDALAGLTKGAALGSVVPGIGTAIGGGIGGLLGVAMNVVPGAAHWLNGSADVAGKAVAAVQAVTGQADPVAAQAALDSDPTLAGDLRVQLAQIANDARAEENRSAEARQAGVLADVADARDQTQGLATTGSRIAWGAPVVSVLAVLSFAAAVGVILMHAVPDGSQQAATVLLGALGAGFGQVLNYWLGSSAGSRSKDERIATMLPASLIPKPAAIVPAGDVKGS